MSNQEGQTNRKVVLGGSVWSVASLFVGQGLRLGGNIVLAYLLFPEAFGVLTLVNIYLRGVEMFSDLGVNRAVVQNERGEEPEFLNTAWTIQVLRGLILWLVTCAIAWPFAAAYDEPMLAPYLIVSGLLLITRGFESSSLFLLKRRVAIKKLAILDIITQLGALLFMSTWAYLYPSPWALVSGAVVGGCLRVLISHVWFREHRPSFQWNWKVARELNRFGKWIFLSSIVTFLAAEGDRLMLGILIEKAELGLYGIALAYMTMMVHIADRLFNMVLFPVLSRSQSDVQKMTAMFLEARHTVLQLCAVACAAIVVGAPLFFELLYDERYIRAGYYAQWLACPVWAFILICGVDLVPLAMGNSRVQFMGSLIRSSGVLLGGAGFYLHGIPGLVCGFSASSILALAYLLRRLPAEGGAVAWQSLRVSLGLGAYVAVYLLLDADGYAVPVVLTLLPLGVGAGLVLKLLPSLRGK